MKWHAVIVLLAIALTVLAPPSLPLMVERGGQAEIGALEVCHSATPALSSTGEMPCMNSLPPLHRPDIAITYTTSQKPFFVQLLSTFDNEQPPKA